MNIGFHRVKSIELGPINMLGVEQDTNPPATRDLIIKSTDGGFHRIDFVSLTSDNSSALRIYDERIIHALRNPSDEFLKAASKICFGALLERADSDSNVARMIIEGLLKELDDG